MKAAEFCYWLQGAFELGDLKTLDEKKTAILRAHLALVFLHEIDPSYGDATVQEERQEVHDQGTKPAVAPTVDPDEIDVPKLRKAMRDAMDEAAKRIQENKAIHLSRPGDRDLLISC